MFQLSRRLCRSIPHLRALEIALDEEFDSSRAITRASLAARHLIKSEVVADGRPALSAEDLLKELLREERESDRTPRAEGDSLAEAPSSSGGSSLLDLTQDLRELESKSGIRAKLHRGNNARRRPIGHMLLDPGSSCCDLHASEVLGGGAVATLTNIPTYAGAVSLFPSGTTTYFHFILHKRRVSLGTAFETMSAFAERESTTVSPSEFAVNIVLDDIACTTQLCSVVVRHPDVIRKLVRINLRPEHRIVVDPVGVSDHPCSLARGLRSQVRYAGIVRGMPHHSRLLRSAFARGLSIAPNFFGARRTGAHLPFSYFHQNAAMRRDQFRELLLMKMCNDLVQHTRESSTTSESSFFDVPWRAQLIELLRSERPGGKGREKAAPAAHFERVFSAVPAVEKLLVEAAPAVLGWNLQLSEALQNSKANTIFPSSRDDVLSRSLLDALGTTVKAAVHQSDLLHQTLQHHVKLEMCSHHMSFDSPRPHTTNVKLRGAEKEHEGGRDNGVVTARNAVGDLTSNSHGCAQRHVFSCPVADEHVNIRVLPETTDAMFPVYLASDRDLAAGSSGSNMMKKGLDRRGYGLTDRLPAGCGALHLAENTMKSVAFEVTLPSSGIYIGSHLREAVILSSTAVRERTTDNPSRSSFLSRANKNSPDRSEPMKAGAAADDRQPPLPSAFRDPSNLLRPTSKLARPVFERRQ